MTKTDGFFELERLSHRAQGIMRWLKENGGACFEEQLHLSEGTKERIYWHYGYMAALSDVLYLLTGEQPLATAPCMPRQGRDN
jgi:hypothetical protein